MADAEPTLLGEPSGEPLTAAVPGAVTRADAADSGGVVTQDRTEPTPSPRRLPGTGPDTVYVVGFWRRLVAAAIDFAVIAPIAIVLALIAAKIGGVHLPPSKSRSVDFWIDLILAGDPALVLGFGMALGVALLYLLIFQLTMARTLGMRVLRLKIIDTYGDAPSPQRCVVRSLGYVASITTLFLGFFWIGFDAEKRGLHDWIAGTYVVRS